MIVTRYLCRYGNLCLLYHFIIIALNGKNDPMGEGPVLRALVEMIDAPAYTEIKAEQQYDKIK